MTITPPPPSLQNMVGPGEVDEELEPEVKEECETKYGDIIRVTSGTTVGHPCTLALPR